MSRVEADVLLSDRYQLVRRMAVGGMGQVWEAEDTVLHRTVAVKVLSDGLSSDPNSSERFRREARAAAGLSHPNVAGVFDYGEDDGTQFIVMELVAGETLAERLRREGRLGPAEAARIAVEIASALEAAHAAGIVHRDVKPGNVMLTDQSEVKVLDFGIAAASGHDLTATGFTMGTAAYLSPEQAAGERATPSSDLYALGVVLYEMLTGHPPFTGETPVAMAAAHASQSPAPLSDEVRGVPASIASACERALAKDPADRPSSAGAFRQMLEAGLVEASGASTAAVPSDGVGAETTMVLPPSAATATLPRSGATEPVSPAAPARSRAAIAVAGILVGVLLVAFLLSRVFGSDLTSANAVRVRIPAVTGLKAAAAQRLLKEEGFKVTLKHVNGAPGTVLRTSPAQGKSVAAGSTVTLFVGSSPASPGRGEEGKGKGKDKGKGHGDGNGGGGGD